MQKIKFRPVESSFKDELKCQKRKVSFEKDASKAVTKGSEYFEWMLSCEVEERVKTSQLTSEYVPFAYFVGRAYNNHLAFVYIRHHLTRQWYVKYIGKNINPLFDKCVEPHCIRI